MQNRPELSQKISVADFKNFYWLKTELITFCKAQKIPSQGSKLDLAQRIEVFLSTGEDLQSQSANKSVPFYDSDKEITTQTRVVYYKNDAKTRAFFVAHLGNKFRFNAYLRAFAKQKNDGKLCYGDLIQGYKASLTLPKPDIEQQFEYNQFQRDFYKNSPDKTQLACSRAWKLVKSTRGGCTYEDYIKLL